MDIANLKYYNILYKKNIRKEVIVMNIQKFTQKSLEAIQNAQNIAIQNQNAQVEQEHILYALLSQEDSLIKQLLKRMNVSGNFESEVKREIEKKSKVTGGAMPSNGIYVSQDVDIMLANSEKIAEDMKDDYVSVEHIMISLFDNSNRQIKELFNTFNITKNGFLKVLSSVRGSTRVTTDNPESTYNVLEKYGQEMLLGFYLEKQRIIHV